MKSNYRNLAVSVLTLAVQGALAAMFAIPGVAMAEDDEVAALTNPTNSVEIGATDVSKSSAKFGEYNGLNKSGGSAIANFSVRGGDSYGQKEGTQRWSITGTDLGTTSRELGASVGSQGKWDLGVRYDELRHNITDTYQTPLQGSMGGNSFIMPTSFGVIDTKNKPNAVGGVIPPYGTQALTPAQVASLQTQDVHSDRKNSSLSAGYNINQQWGVRFDFNHLAQSGAKLISAATDGNNTAAGFTKANIGAEKIMMLMNPTNYKTDTINLAVNWMGDKGNFSGSYYVSLFSDAYNGLNFSNPYYYSTPVTAGVNQTGNAPPGAYPVNTLSTAPDNAFHQLNLKGGYEVAPSTKLVGGYSYGRNTQNMAYTNADQMQGGVLPQASLNGLVVTTHADLKLTNQTTKDLALNVGVKYNKRDNQTASGTYNFIDLGTKPRTSISTPMSNKKTQFELGADYRIDHRQSVNLGYELEKISRWCNSSPTLAQIQAAYNQLPAAGGFATADAATATAYYANGYSCAQVPSSKENKLAVNYKLKANDDVNFNVGYGYSRRSSDINNFYNPMQSIIEGFENFGYVAYFDASRKEQMLKAGVNWQASDKLAVTLSGRYVGDKYDSTLGVQNGNADSVNLDSTYSVDEQSSVSAYATWQQRRRDLLTANGRGPNALLPNQWSNNLTDDATTVGVGGNKGGLMSGKLNLKADLTYSLAKSTYATGLNYVSASCTTPSNAGYACGTLPDIKSTLVQFKLTGDYKLDKASKVIAGYMYQNLKSEDYYYNAYQTGYTATSMMQTNQQAPSYSVNEITVSYLYNF